MAAESLVVELVIPEWVVDSLAAEFGAVCLALADGVVMADSPEVGAELVASAVAELVECQVHGELAMARMVGAEPVALGAQADKRHFGGQIPTILLQPKRKLSGTKHMRAKWPYRLNSKLKLHELILRHSKI